MGIGSSVVASSRHRAWRAALFGALALGCSVGQGSGAIGGPVLAPDCEVEQPDYQLHPSFFTGEVTGEQLNLRIQRGSTIEGYADGMIIHVRDVNEVRRQRIGLPIPVDATADSLVQVVLYLNETCKTGFPDEFNILPLTMEAVSGTITFDSIYAPDLDAGATGIEAELADLRFEDAERPDERNATMNGWFSFFYQRGSPAQRFP